MKMPFLTAMLGLALLYSAPQNPANSGTVEGIVRNAENREPIEGVEVALKGGNEATAAAMLHAVRTDNRGHFLLKDVAPGEYSLLKRRLGYLSPNDDAWWEAEVQVGPQQNVAGLVFELVPCGSISGRVFGANGEPVVGTRVIAAEPAYVDGIRDDRGPSATTDDQGRYRLFWLMPGEYHLLAEYSPFRPGLESSEVFFPGTFEERAARLVVVRPGADLTGIDFVFPTPSIAPTFTITGVIHGVPAATDRDSSPSVRLIPRGGETGANDSRFSNNVSTHANGQFQIRGVRAGVYDLYSWVEDDKRNAYASKTSIEVSSNIENLEITMQPGVDIRVRVTVNGSPPAGVFGDNDPDLIPIAGIFPSYYNGLFSILEGYRSDKNSGQYVLPKVPPGQYRLKYRADSLENAYIADIRQNGRSVFDEGFIIDNRTPEPLEIAIATSGGIVQGEVRDVRGNSVPPTTVVLVPIPERRKNPLLFRTWRSGKKGEFRIPNVAPGAYKVFAWAKPPFGEPWRNAEFMSQYEQRGQSVQVDANQTVSVQVTVIPKAGP